MNNGTRVRVDGIDRHEWCRLLESFDDASLYQTAAYGEVRWGEANLSRIAVYGAEGSLVSAAQIRILKVPLLQTGIAYVRYGPLWRLRGRQRSIASFRAGLRALVDEYATRRGLLLRIRPFGLQETDPDMQAALEAEGLMPTSGLYRDRCRTILIDLEVPEAILRERMRRNWRRNLRAAEKAKLQIVESYETSLFENLRSLYTEMMLRKRFKAGSNVNEYARMQLLLPPAHKIRLSVCRVNGETVSGSACSGIGDTVIGLFAATNPAGRDLSAFFLMQWDEIQWSKAAGKRFYDLNGINPLTNPGVYYFKSRLGGREVTHLEVFDRCERRLFYRLVMVIEALMRIWSSWSDLSRWWNLGFARSRKLY